MYVYKRVYIRRRRRCRRVHTHNLRARARVAHSNNARRRRRVLYFPFAARSRFMALIFLHSQGFKTAATHIHSVFQAERRMTAGWLLCVTTQHRLRLLISSSDSDSDRTIYQSYVRRVCFNFNHRKYFTVASGIQCVWTSIGVIEAHCVRWMDGWIGVRLLKVGLMCAADAFAFCALCVTLSIFWRAERAYNVCLCVQNITELAAPPPPPPPPMNMCSGSGSEVSSLRVTIPKSLLCARSTVTASDGDDEDEDDVGGSCLCLCT